MFIVALSLNGLGEMVMTGWGVGVGGMPTLVHIVDPVPPLLTTVAGEEVMMAGTITVIEETVTMGAGVVVIVAGVVSLHPLLPRLSVLIK